MYRKKENRLKKLIFIIALIAVMAVQSLKAQLSDNWKWLNPSPQGNTLHAVDFVDNNIGYAAGAYGTVLKTTNAGSSWNKLTSPTGKNLTSLDLINSSTGFAGSNSQMLKKTTDAGQTWQSVQLPVSGNWDTAYTIMDINFVNQTTGYVVGFFLMESKIWKTTDAGNSWSTLPVTGADYLKRTYFLDANTGFAYGGPTYSEVIKTTNGGQSWQQVSQESYIAYSMAFIDAQVGVYGCESGRVYRTTDGGNSWTFAFCPSSLDILSIQFINASTGFGFGTGSVYIKTTDGGLNWNEYSLGTGSIRQYYDAAMTPAGVIQAVGSYGAMVRTTNSGATFEVPPFITEHTITDIEFIDANTGYAVAGFGEGDILKTTDAGETWVSQVSSYTLPQYGIAFVNSQTGYLAGSINIKKTTNGGANWVNVYNSTTNEIFGDIFFTDINTGYAVGSYGRLIKTTNGGASWNSSTIPGSSTFINTIYFTDALTGYAAGNDNKALKTTDGGSSWQMMNVASGFTIFNNVFFSNQSTGYVSANNGLYKTTDGGSTWFQLSTPAGGFNCVQFRGNFGYAAAGDGKIIKSTDGGNSWIVQPTVTENSLYALYFNSDDFIYAGGLLGTLMKTIPQELILTGTNNNGNINIPSEFSLSQNYPNPFNPSTTIKFTLPGSAEIEVAVFDINGRLIETLAKGTYNSGSYEVKWNAVNYSSGTYFYRIKAGEFTETKKMILIK